MYPRMCSRTLTGVTTFRSFAVVAAAAVVLAGCGGKSAPKVSPTVPPSVSESDYFAVMHEQMPGVADDVLRRVAVLTCEGFDAGETWSQQVAIATGQGISGYDAGFTIGASVRTFCPQYVGLLPPA